MHPCRGGAHSLLITQWISEFFIGIKSIFSSGGTHTHTKYTNILFIYRPRRRLVDSGFFSCILAMSFRNSNLKTGNYRPQSERGGEAAVWGGGRGGVSVVILIKFLVSAQCAVRNTQKRFLDDIVVFWRLRPDTHKHTHALSFNVSQGRQDTNSQQYHCII